MEDNNRAFYMTFSLPAGECTVRLLGLADEQNLLAARDNIALHREHLDEQAQGEASYIGAFIGARAVGFVLLVHANKQDVMPYTGGEPCMDIVDLHVADALRGQRIGSALVEAAERLCAAYGISYIGLDVNPSDNPRAKLLYERLGYRVVGALHLDNVYPSKDEQGNDTMYEDWCVDMIKRMPARGM